MSRTDQSPTLSWLADGGLEIDGQHYRVTGDVSSMHELASTREHLVLAKPRGMVERFERRFSGEITYHVIELGIFKGGGTAFLAQVLTPKKLVAVELSPEPVAALERFIDERHLGEVVSLHYGVNQGDQAALAAIADEEFGTEQIDLVVDDASHFYAESRSSFEVLFPRLRPGGRYVIENWAWAHYDSALFQRDGGYGWDRPALTNLVVEIMLVLGSFTDIVTAVHVDHDSAEVVRGRRPLPGNLDLSRLYTNRGHPFRPLL